MCENQAVEYYLNTAITNIFVSATVRTVPGSTLFSSCLCLRQGSCTKSLLTLYLMNRLCEFHQIHIFGAFGDKDKLVRF